MIKQTDSSLPVGGNMCMLNEIKADYHPINKSLKFRVSAETRKNISLVGNQVILKGNMPMEIGTLIQLKFDLKSLYHHRFGNRQGFNQEGVFIGIGQVLTILESRTNIHKMLIRLLDIHDM